MDYAVNTLSENEITSICIVNYAVSLNGNVSVSACYDVNVVSCQKVEIVHRS